MIPANIAHAKKSVKINKIAQETPHGQGSSTQYFNVNLCEAN